MRSKTAAVVAALVVAAGTVGFGGAGPAGADPADPSPAQPTPGQAPGPAPGPGEARPAGTIDHDGTYAVGSEIAPGTYRSAGPVEDGTCYWKRTRDGAIVDNAMTKKPQVVRVEPTDTQFRTSGCQPWQLDGAAQAPAPLDPAAAQNELRGFVGQLNLGSMLHGGGTVAGP